MKKALAIAAALVLAGHRCRSTRVRITSHLLRPSLIYAILLFGLDIVFGYTGEVSLGHSGLFGIGAYAAGCLVHHQLLLGGASPNPADIIIALVLGRRSRPLSARFWRCPHSGLPAPISRW